MATLGVVAWVLLFAGLFQSELLRAAVAVFCIVLMLYQWRRYRSTTSGARLIFLSLIVAGFALSFVWLALNVIRFYTYVGEPGPVLHVFVVRVQESLVWVIGTLVVVVSVWALLEVAGWLGAKCRQALKGSNP